MAASWGDPTTESFRKKYIRGARPAGATALVNTKIVDVVCRVIEGLSDLHMEIPETVTSWDPDGTEAQRLGLAIHLPRPTTVDNFDDIGRLLKRWGFDGFALNDDPKMVEFRFVLDTAAAEDLNEQAKAARIDVLDSPDVAGPPVVFWPGMRDLLDGDSGPDVRFLRLVLNAEPFDDPVDDNLREVVRRFQSRRGAAITGDIDVHLWRRILPERRPSVVQGDTGFIVRVVQSALAAYESAKTPVTGVWGVLTARDVTALQTDYNIQRRPAVRDPEWALLLGPEIPRVEEARRAAKGVGVPELQPEEPQGDASALTGA